MKTVAIILAAGKGTRMAHELPKALVPIKGVPLTLRTLAAVERSAFGTKPVVVVGYRKQLVKKAVGSRAQFVNQTKQLGTGHAVAVTKKLLNNKASDIVVVYADSPLVKPATLRSLVQVRRRMKAVMSLVTIRVPDFRGIRGQFKKYGHILRDPSGTFLQECVEYKNATPKQRAIRELNSGFYCFDAKWLWKSLPKLKPKAVSGEYYLTDLMGLAVSEGKRVAILPLKDWREGLGINTLEDVRVVEKFI